VTARPGGPRHLNLTFSAADRQIAPPFPVAGRRRRFIGVNPGAFARIAALPRSEIAGAVLA
jgi:hypothetical protein